jgi:translation initiation factor 2B subunit (eIF-2B alpha/beta/delta family)
MKLQEMLEKTIEFLASLNPAEMSMNDAMLFANAVANVAQAEAASRQTNALEQIADLLNTIIDAEHGTLDIAAPRGISTMNAYEI